MTRWPVTIFSLVLTACTSPCPGISVKQWSPNEQDQIKAAIDQLPPDSILIPVVEDYERLRLEAKATR